MVDVEEIRPGLAEEAGEVGARFGVVEAVAAQRIALIEVVHQRPYPDPAVVELHRRAGRQLPVGGARVDRDRAARLLRVRQPPGVHLGAGEVLRRPAVHEVHHALPPGCSLPPLPPVPPSPPMPPCLRYRPGSGRGALPQRCENRLPGRAERILGHEARETGAEVGIAPPQGPLGGADPTVALGAEAALPLVEDEGGVVEAVLPPGGGGAQAEIDLFAVAETEGRDVERADLREQRALDEEAEPDRRRHLRTEARGRRFDERGEVVDVEAGRQAVDLERARDRGQGAVVGERRDGSDARRAGRRGGELVEPAARHDGVAVEQHDVGGGRGRPRRPRCRGGSPPDSRPAPPGGARCSAGPSRRATAAARTCSTASSWGPSTTSRMR